MRQLAIIAAAFLFTSQAIMAEIVIKNNDAPGEGFNDPTPITPAGGNAAITLGQARLNLFRHSALLIDQMINSPVTITVRAEMNALGGSANSATLGGAAPLEVFKDFPNAPRPNTWYVGALANALQGVDLSAEDEISSEFNSDIDGDVVLGSTHWYYGFDEPPNNDIEFLPTVKHELIHGLGFLSLVQPDGSLFLGFMDTYSLNLERHGTTPADFPSMTNAQRVAAMIDDGNLHWTGSNVRSASSFLSAGKLGDHVQMYAPGTFAQGSSVSHFDIDLVPDDLMEPFLTDDPYIIMDAALLNDIGWNIVTNNPSLDSTDLLTSAQITGNVNPGTNPTSLSITAINNSIYPAPNSAFELIIPAGVLITNATLSSGSCEQITNLLRCNLGTLPALSDTVQLVLDAETDGSAKELSFNLSSPLSDHSMSNNSASLVINPPAVSPDISITNAQAEEGDTGDTTGILFTVQLSAATSTAINVNFASSENTATSGSDFQPVSGILTIPSGSTSALIQVPIIPDDIVEPDETFTLTISSPSNGVITSGNATGTIVNDDPLAFSISNTSVIEGNTGQTSTLLFPVSLSHPYSSDLSVDYFTQNGSATSPADYLSLSGSLIILAGETSGTIAITVNGDDVYEANETLSIFLSNPLSPATIDQDTATGTITNDDAAPSSGGGGGGSMGLFLLALLLTLLFRPRLLNQLKR